MGRALDKRSGRGLAQIWHWRQSCHDSKLLERRFDLCTISTCERLWLSCTTPVATQRRGD